MAQGVTERDSNLCKEGKKITNTEKEEPVR